MCQALVDARLPRVCFVANRTIAPGEDGGVSAEELAVKLGHMDGFT